MSNHPPPISDISYNNAAKWLAVYKRFVGLVGSLSKELGLDPGDKVTAVRVAMSLANHYPDFSQPTTQIRLSAEEFLAGQRVKLEP